MGKTAGSAPSAEPDDHLAARQSQPTSPASEVDPPRADDEVAAAAVADDKESLDDPGTMRRGGPRAATRPDTSSTWPAASRSASAQSRCRGSARMS